MKYVPRVIKKGIRSTIGHPLLSPLRRRFSGLGSCLLYHRITQERPDPTSLNPYRSLSVHVEEFEQQIAILKEEFQCISLEQAIHDLNKGTLSPESAILSFDDGYKDNLTLALPILEKYEVPATLFITTGLIERSFLPWWYEQEFLLQDLNEIEIDWKGKRLFWPLGTPVQRYSAMNDINCFFKGLNIEDQEAAMAIFRSKTEQRFTYHSEVLTWEDVEYLDRHPLITIGAHTKNHAVLNQLSDKALFEELTVSKQVLEDRLNHPIDFLAYPFGAASQVGTREFEATRVARYKAAFTTRYGHIHYQHRHHLFSLPRIFVGYEDGAFEFRQKLSGIDSLLQYKGRRVVTE